MQLKQNVEMIRQAAPSDAVLFANETVCDALDSVGGYQLYDTALFSNTGFNNFLAIYSRNLNLNDDPCPVQWDRARYYVQLLGHKVYSGAWLWNITREHLQKQGVKINLKDPYWQRVQYYVEKVGWWIDPGAWVVKDAKDRVADQVAIYRKAAAAGKRILVLRRMDDKVVTMAPLIPNVQGVNSKKIAFWTNVPAVEASNKAWFIAQRARSNVKYTTPPLVKWELFEVQVNLAQLSTSPPAPTPATPVSPVRTPANRPAARPVGGPATRPAAATTRPASTRPIGTRPAAASTKPAATRPK